MPAGTFEQSDPSLPPAASQSWGTRGTVGPVFAGHIELRDLTFDIGDKRLLSGINLTLKAGEVACLLGPSGCGKSTLLRIIAGLVPQTTGEIFLDGVEIAGHSNFVPPEKRSIGLMFQDFALFPHLTVLQNVMFGLYALSPKEAEQSAVQALQRVGLHQFRNVYPSTLSGGEQQRVALARTIVPRPQIVLMDEPFSGLDQRLRETIRAETLAVLREMRATVLLVTHDPEEAFEIADQLILMRSGQIIQQGEPFTVHDRPTTLDAARYFPAAGEFVGTVAKNHVETLLGNFPVANVTEGTSLTLLLRPEAIVLSDDPGATPGRVLSTRRQGRGQQCLVQLTGINVPMTVRVDSPQSASVGEIRGFSLARDHVLVFETETGRPI